MGVYIEGMKMPTKENAVILITPSGDVWKIGEMPNEDTHLVKAKAIPVPPHGRLIDQDALIESLEMELKKYGKLSNALVAYAERHNNYRFTANWDDACLCVVTAPTIIPADPEKEGN